MIGVVRRGGKNGSFVRENNAFVTGLFKGPPDVLMALLVK
jgi:hypothetical protein